MAMAFGLGGCWTGDEAVAPADQPVVVTMTEYAFASGVVPAIRAGETFRFVEENAGRLVHEIRVVDDVLDPIVTGGPITVVAEELSTASGEPTERGAR